MLVIKETELAAWQKRTLDSCVEYQRALIRLGAHLPPQAALAVDEKYVARRRRRRRGGRSPADRRPCRELMEEGCAASVARAAEALRRHAAELAGQRACLSRARAQHSQHREAQLVRPNRPARLPRAGVYTFPLPQEETRAKIAEIKAAVERERQAAEADAAREATEAEARAVERRQLAERLDALRHSEREYDEAKTELEFWEAQDEASVPVLCDPLKIISERSFTYCDNHAVLPIRWRNRLAEMQEYIVGLQLQLGRDLAIERRRRADLLKDTVADLHRALAKSDAEEIDDTRTGN